MTVAELIKALSQFDPDLKVVVDGYEGGFDDPRISETDAVLDANWDGQRKKKQWDGRHDWGDDSKPNTRVLLLGR
jgi:hypothetical protein